MSCKRRIARATSAICLAVKLTFAAAHEIAKRKAPARVHVVTADKTDDLNVDLRLDHGVCSYR